MFRKLVAHFSFVTLIKLNVMEINWIIIGVVVIVAVVLVFFLIKTNSKDEKDFETFLNKNDLPIDIEEEEANNTL